jgi:hypothetical protein
MIICSFVNHKEALIQGVLKMGMTGQTIRERSLYYEFVEMQ